MSETTTTASAEASAKKHGFSPAAVTAASDALKRSGGTSAQFSNPELGGSVQWMGGGMLQIGDMFNHELKARVAALLADLSQQTKSAPSPSENPGQPEAPKPSNWWPNDLGSPSSTGGQNDMRYAYFPDARRLLVDEGGKKTLYDTLDHRINGVAQQQGSGATRLAFASDKGPVPIESLRVVS